MDFDPDAASGAESGLFGLPHGPDDAYVHVLGVPYEATVSYRAGARHGPEAVLAASRQIDLFDLRFGRPYERGIWMAQPSRNIVAWNEEARALASPIIERGGAEESDARAIARVDELSSLVNDAAHAFFAERLESGRLPVLVGGDHSTPFGAIAACAAHHPGLGVLHFDAHADLRPAFEGFRWSHASILRNVLDELDGVQSLIQVGVRDLCEQEHDAIAADERVDALFDHGLAEARFEGRVRTLARETIARLPNLVYVTFDADGLDPSLCPNTGTPVPGGLDWQEAVVWLEELARSGKRIVGLDLVEVSPGPDGDPEGRSWDAIVGARLLYRMIGAALASGR
ncbi:MAG: agmatinase family protein [Planctomycetota bacterium]